MEKNVGNLDASLRFLFGILLYGLGLFSMEGINGNPWGILVAHIYLWHRLHFP